ncbi:hypothetical protein NE865_01459 [Phthorimaea operculella]|nr:hypothetical protein NE865_01459 [Phthorimaea operculella]
MGNWKLEVGKMAIYMSFPVTMFHYFNQPDYFEEWVIKTKRECYPPENKKDREDIEKLIKKLKMKEIQNFD